MSKKEARRFLAARKPGVTVKEFLGFAADMGYWFDEIVGTELELVYLALCQETGT